MIKKIIPSYTASKNKQKGFKCMFTTKENTFEMVYILLQKHKFVRVTGYMQ